MNIAGLLFLLITQFLAGRGLLQLFKLQLTMTATICFSCITGVALISFVPCMLQLLSVPLTATYVTIAISIFASLFTIPLLKHLERPQFRRITLPKFYEWPFLLVCLALVLFSIWRCYYLPPYSRDMLSGPELIAEYSVREGTMINSVFSVDLSTSNNYFKSPYITCLQIIYKLLVCPFGQLWLSMLFLSFTFWIYTLLRERLHPLLAGLLLLLFLAIPEMYAYTFQILYDYSNMIFFFSGFYFMVSYFESQQPGYFAFSVFLFGMATYIRTETLVLILMMVPLLLVYLFREKISLKKVAYRLALFVAIPATFYLLCIHVFVKQFIPLPFDVSSQLNPNLGDVSVLFQRLGDIGTKLIFSKIGLTIYGGYFLLFATILLADIIWPRQFNRMSLLALYGIAVVYLGLGLLGYLIPAVDLLNTTKRGLFKAIPLILIYFSNSGLLIRFSALIRKWEDEKASGIITK